MRVLLDTNVFLWLQTEPERLGGALPLLEDPTTTRLVSAVVGWEIAIKHALGRLTLPQPPDLWVPRMMAAGVMTPLPIELAPALAAGALPPIHGDPFDRLLVAQAQHLDVPLITGDRIFRRYGVETIEV